MKIYDEDNPKTVDYSAQAQQSYNEGNIRGAAKAEQNRNVYNALNGNPSANTYNYAGALDHTDYSALGNAQMNSGIGAGVVAATGTMRGGKSANTRGYEKYMNDDTQKAMESYAANGGFQYSDPYGYQDMIAGMNGGIMNRINDYADNSYSNYRAGPEYRNLADLYRQNGQLAMEDTLGTASQMSGGLDSSYAVAAAQQAYNGYMSNLEAAAQAAYKDEMANQAAGINALQNQQQLLAGFDNNLYNREYDLMQYNTDSYLKTLGMYMDDRYRTNALEQDNDQFYANQAYNIWNTNKTLDQNYDLTTMGYGNDQIVAGINAGNRIDVANLNNANSYAIAGMNNATDMAIAQLKNGTGGTATGTGGAGILTKDQINSLNYWEGVAQKGNDEERATAQAIINQIRGTGSAKPTPPQSSGGKTTKTTMPSRPTNVNTGAPAPRPNKTKTKR